MLLEALNEGLLGNTKFQEVLAAEMLKHTAGKDNGPVVDANLDCIDMSLDDESIDSAKMPARSKELDVSKPLPSDTIEEEHAYMKRRLMASLDKVNKANAKKRAKLAAAQKAAVEAKEDSDEE